MPPIQRPGTARAPPQPADFRGFCMASRSGFSCYKPVAMTKICSGFARFTAPALALLLGLGGCSILENSAPKDNPYASGVNLPPADVLYAKGVAEVQKEDYDRAVTDFDEVEENYPYSSWATHAQLLAGYSQYKQQNYDDAISALNRFIALHPENQDIAYAYYLKSLCYYEQIDDVQRDQTATYEAIQTLTDVTTRFPDSAYARDARIKLRLANNRLAGHDMEIGRYYEKQHLYGAAIGRFQDVVTSFQTTTYTAEALERLVECYLDIGLTDTAQQTASVLAYNYPGSSWYQTAYNKLRDHNLVADAQTPAPPKTHWFWIF
jgi:outer membrane protein assembly factor BamD